MIFNLQQLRQNISNYSEGRGDFTMFSARRMTRAARNHRVDGWPIVPIHVRNYCSPPSSNKSCLRLFRSIENTSRERPSVQSVFHSKWPFECNKHQHRIKQPQQTTEKLRFNDILMVCEPNVELKVYNWTIIQSHSNEKRANENPQMPKCRASLWKLWERTKN